MKITEVENYRIGEGPEVVEVEEGTIKEEVEVTDVIEVKRHNTGNYTVVYLPGYEKCKFKSTDRAGIHY